MQNNPLSLVLESKSYNLSTASSAGVILNPDTNYKSLIKYSIPDMIPRDESIEFINFSVPYAVIPVSFYTINANNCNLVINENGTTSTYIFEYGNYTASLFINKFRELLGVRWSINLDTIDNVFSIINTSYQFSVLGTTTMDYILGFSGTQTSTNTAPYTIMMPRSCNFFPLPRIIMRCPELASGVMIGNNKASDIILSIPTNSKSNGQIYYQNQTQAKMLYKGNFLNSFTVSLTDDNGNLINFNGLSSFFVFQFDIYRIHQPKPPLFYNLVSYVNSKNKELDLEKQSEEINMSSGN